MVVTKGRKIYCSIAKYLSREYPDIDDILDEYCCKDLIRAGGKPITFLVMSPDTVDSVVNSKFGLMETKSFTEIKTLIKSHIVYGAFEEGKRGVLKTAAGTSVDYTPGKVKDTYILTTAKGKVTVTKTPITFSETEYQNKTFPPNHAVYTFAKTDSLIRDGLFPKTAPTGGNRFPATKRMTKGKGGMRGGARGGAVIGEFVLRSSFTKSFYNQFIASSTEELGGDYSHEVYKFLTQILTRDDTDDSSQTVIEFVSQLHKSFEGNTSHVPCILTLLYAVNSGILHQPKSDTYVYDKTMSGGAHIAVINLDGLKKLILDLWKGDGAPDEKLFNNATGDSVLCKKFKSSTFLQNQHILTVIYGAYSNVLSNNYDVLDINNYKLFMDDFITVGDSITFSSSSQIDNKIWNDIYKATQK